MLDKLHDTKTAPHLQASNVRTPQRGSVGFGTALRQGQGAEAGGTSLSGAASTSFFRRVEVIKWIFIDINGKYVTSPYVQNCSKPYCGYYGDFMGILIPANWNHNLDKNVSNWGC